MVFFTYFVLSQKLSNFALQNHIISYSYGKNDKRNPILTGEDAERFVERAERVENMSKEERAANRARLMERVAEANKHIIWCR